MVKSIQTNLLSLQQSPVLTHQEAKFKSIQYNRTTKCYQETPPPCCSGNSHVHGFLLLQGEFGKAELMRIKLYRHIN